ncbi:uncharacterized protein LOC113323225 isoform X2 [Papaver somniferum]|uniref:uncharacterized protein LOC113323225 isoform X2 n=1 Tax=Papaver somniferum TaxID=3469 RepID=UPI000E702597|nr:uncharacterized protein LOC113323225 isoform X2 [Papaver somniferum]
MILQNHLPAGLLLNLNTVRVRVLNSYPTGTNPTLFLPCSRLMHKELIKRRSSKSNLLTMVMKEWKLTPSPFVPTFEDLDPLEKDSVSETLMGDAGPSSVATTRFLVDLNDFDPEDEEATLNWDRERGLLSGFSPEVPVERDSPSSMETRNRMKPTSFEDVRDDMLRADRISQSFVDVPPASFKEMTSCVDSYTYFFPQYHLSSLARQVDYNFQLYQLYKLKATKFQSLLRDAQTKAGDRETEIEQLKASISGISSAEKTELENLRVEMTKLKETHAEDVEKREDSLKLEVVNLKKQLEDAASAKIAELKKLHKDASEHARRSMNKFIDRVNHDHKQNIHKACDHVK